MFVPILIQWTLKLNSIFNSKITLALLNIAINLLKNLANIKVQPFKLTEIYYQELIFQCSKIQRQNTRMVKVNYSKLPFTMQKHQTVNRVKKAILQVWGIHNGCSHASLLKKGINISSYS